MTPMTAGLVSVSRLGAVSPNTGEGLEFEVIAAVVIGGTSLYGGQGKILRTIIESFAGGPVGLDTIATSVAEEPETLEDVHEPFLIQSGLLARTSRGRVATEQAYRHLGLEAPGQQTLL